VLGGEELERNLRQDQYASFGVGNLDGGGENWGGPPVFLAKTPKQEKKGTRLGGAQAQTEPPPRNRPHRKTPPRGSHQGVHNGFASPRRKKAGWFGGGGRRETSQRSLQTGKRAPSKRKNEGSRVNDISGWEVDPFSIIPGRT